MSFYEGLHRHTALVLSLTSSAFNFTKNEITYKSLTSEFFSQQQIENFKHDKPIGAAPRCHIFWGGRGPFGKKGVTLRGLRISEKKEILRKPTVL